MTPAKTRYTVYFTTVVRSAPAARGGELVRLNWSDKTISLRVPVLPRHPEMPDPNDRGGRRGGRGIGLLGGNVVVGSCDTLYTYDRDLNVLRSTSHPLMAGIHEILVDQAGGVWVTATAIDALLRFDLASGRLTQEYWPREMPSFQRSLGLTASQIDKSAEHRHRVMDPADVGHVHLNAVAVWEGAVYALFNSQGKIVNLDNGSVVIEDPALLGAHNLVIGADGVALVNQTLRPALGVYDVRKGKALQVIDLSQFRWVRRLRQLAAFSQLTRRLRPAGSRPTRARPLFARGLDVIGDRAFVGISPASILCVDWPTGRLVDQFRYSTDVQCCVHGLKAVRR